MSSASPPTAVPAAPLLHWLLDQEPEVRARDGWNEQPLLAGETLCSEGDPADFMSVVVSGRLAVVVDGQQVDVLGPGGTVGEASNFFDGELRKATIRALEATQLFSLSRTDLLRLRFDSPQSYQRLLDIALHHVWHLLGRQSDAVARHTGSSDAAGTPGRRTGLRRLFRSLLRREPRPPNAVLALTRVATFDRAEPSDLGALARACAPQRVEAGYAVVHEGEATRELFIVADGRLEVVRSAGAGTARLAVLNAGAIVGIGAFLFGSPRDATVVALEPAWTLTLTPDAATSLPPSARRALDEALLGTLRQQLRATNTILSGPNTSDGSNESPQQEQVVR